MASVTAGEVLGIKAPASGETVRLPIMLLDSDGAVVTGEAFDAAGMTIATKKEGASAFTTFPTFGTENWDEIGYGMYEVIVRESDADEKALLDTGGHFVVYVKTTATRGDVFLFKVNPADTVRDDQWTDAKAAFIDALVSSRGTADPGDQMDLQDVPNATAVAAILVEILAGIVDAHGSGGYNKGGAIVLSAESLELTVTGGEVVDDDGSIAVTRDDDTDIQFTWTDQVITGYTFYLTVRESLTEAEDDDDSEALFQLVAVNDDETSSFVFTTTKTQTDECTVGTTYWYDVCAFDGDGNIVTLLKAPFAVTGDVTRRITVAE